VFVCGGGVVNAGATAELAAVAELLGAPVCTTVSGRGCLADAHPLHVGVVGANGGLPCTQAVLAQADLVLFIGCRVGSTTTGHWKTPARDVTILHIDADPMTIGANYRTAVGLVGDARLALQALDAALRERLPQRVPDAVDGRTLARQAQAEKWARLDALAASTEQPIRPEVVVHALNRLLPSRAVVVADPGTPCPYLAAYFQQPQAGRHFITNRAHGALGYSMAAGFGAAIARPDATVVSVMGDGSFGFTSGELETIVRLKLPIMMVVVSNSVFGWIKAGQKTGFGERYFSVDFSRTDHAKVAEAFGVKSWRVSDPAMLKTALAAAAEYGGPTLVDVITQPLHEANAPVSEWVA